MAATDKNLPPAAIARDLYRQATELYRKQEFAPAQRLLEESLTHEKTAEAYHDLGVIHFLSGRPREALASYEAAININPGFDSAYTNAAIIFLEQGQIHNAMDCYARAIRAKPDNPLHKEKLVRIFQRFRFTVHNPNVKALLLECLQAGDVDLTEVGLSWFSILQADPAFAATYKTARKGNYDAFKKAFGAPGDHAALRDPYFITGLKKLLVPDPGFEQFLTFLRRYLLENESGGPDFVTLAEALSHYCFLTEYILDFTGDEKAKADELRRRVESGEAAGDARALAVLACYTPLHQLTNAAAIAKAPLPALSGLIKRQIGDYARQQEIKRALPALTEIGAGFSSEVRGQYEVYPYPRWTTFAHEMSSDTIEDRVRKKSADIFSAGCGTGKQALEFGYIFPDAKILAVDLSLSSLAYGAQKAEDSGLKNITFKQADLMALGGFDQRFDLIACTGVFPCMENYFEGWRILRDLLKPGGVMAIALYSERARQPIVKAREIIAKKGYSPDDAGMRHFRRECEKLLSGEHYKRITGYRDFYSMSECRDLLFHVHERRADLGEIRSYIEKLDMEFLNFELSPEITQQYLKMFPDDPQARNLKNWEAFENRNPDTFVEMYRFCCRKVQ